MDNVKPSSVTLIFYRLGPLTTEPLLNIVASAMQMSSLCHCEIAIGDSVGSRGQMVNVARVFNDYMGVVTLHASRTPPVPNRDRTCVAATGTGAANGA